MLSEAEVVFPLVLSHNYPSMRCLHMEAYVVISVREVTDEDDGLHRMQIFISLVF